ncbi:MAG: hypothetical protein KAJ24_02790 [Candidatus Aenigmarchaeota archaeon]|nr:hypothetical protein [Candidatus Aenigmarchaeota archaeon]
MTEIDNKERDNIAGQELRDLVPYDQITLPAKYADAMKTLTGALDRTCENLTPDQRTTFKILGEQLGHKFTKRIEELRKSPDAEEAYGTVLTIAANITNYLDAHTTEPVEKYAAIGVLTDMMMTAVRYHPHIVEDEGAQRIIDDAFVATKDLTDIVSTEFHLGPKAVGDANKYIEEYFEMMQLNLTVFNMDTVTNPVQLLINDWYAASNYCKRNGAPEEAFLKDGTPLFRFAPDCLEYVKEHFDEFPGLNPSKVNDGAHVEQWLRSTPIGMDKEHTKLANWLVLLTGYTPNDNIEIPLLCERYNEAIVSTAIDKELSK